LQDPVYYTTRYSETHWLREKLHRELSEFGGWEIIPGVANFLLCHLPDDGPDAATYVKQCRGRGLFLRDAGAMGRALGNRALRLAVKDAETNRRMIGIMAEVAARAPATWAAE